MSIGYVKIIESLKMDFSSFLHTNITPYPSSIYDSIKTLSYSDFIFRILLK